MKGKPYARAGAVGGPAKADVARAEAFQRLFNGNGSKEDAEIVLTHLADVTGYYRRPNYAEWMARTKTTSGFELHSALSNARAEVVQIIMDFILMSDDQKIELERAARLEAQQ